MKTILSFLFILICSSSYFAATFKVTKTEDTNDGICNADCSLREAISTSNSGDAIVFDEVFFSTNRVINLTLGELQLNKSLTIYGSGADKLTVRRSASIGDVFFRVFNNSASSVISNLTVAGGYAQSAAGGGIHNSGSLILTNVEIRDNNAFVGGGIANDGNLGITNSSISFNTSSGGAGGIDNLGTMSVVNTTISNNQAGTNGGGFINIYGTASFSNVTVALNTAASIGGGILRESGTVNLLNVLVADNISNSGQDVFGLVNSEGHNLIESITGEISGVITGNIIGVDPKFDTAGLQLNGGTTRTIALQRTSPAVDKGRSTSSTTDQRNRIRPYDYVLTPNAAPGGDGSDIGAFELRPDFLERTQYDFDGDRRADVSVFRPSNGFWYRINSLNNSFYAVQFGVAKDLIAPADYDGDGKTDIAVFREGEFGYFYILNSSDNTFRFAQFGRTGDVPVVGDWDGDGRADLAVYRASTGLGENNFYYRPSSQATVNFVTIPFGLSNGKPVVADFDGDGRVDAAFFVPFFTTYWSIRFSSTNESQMFTFGSSTDIPVPADYDGDGKANIAVFRPSTGTWYTSQNQATNFGAIQFGANGDMPVPGDYDGDGRADAAVFRPSNGAWYLNRTTSGFTGVQFGISGDKPAPNAFIR